MPSKSELALKWPVYRPRNWGKPTKNRPLPRPWFGLDTERDAKDGRFVCGRAVGETVVSFGKKWYDDLEPGTYWIYNLGYDIEGMLRDLGIVEAWAARADGSKFPLLDGEACYYHGKRFDFEYGEKRLSFLEASSFFGRVPLSAIGSKVGIDGSQMSYDKYHNDKSSFLCRLSDRKEMTYQEAVNWYCEEDARIVYRAMIDLDMGVQTLGVELGATPGATARRFLARLGQFPDVLWKTQRAFLRSYCGGRFEVTKRGVLHDVYQYDLVSAYPWALAQCPWLTNNAEEKITRRFSDDALYGTYEVSFKFDNYLGIAPRWKKGIRVYSKAEESTWLARPEVDWLIRNGADITIHRGVEVFDESATDLWRQVIYELFEMKKKGKKSPEGLGAKIILNSQYGILIQLVRRNGEWVLVADAKNPVDWVGELALEEPPKEFEGGKYYAPLYAGDLTSRTRVRLLDAGIAFAEAYAGGHTDSALATRTMKSGPLTPVGENLGDWKLEKAAPKAQIRGTGLYAIGDTVKVRGITRKGTPDLLWAETHQRKSRVGIKTAKSWDEVSLILPKMVANNYTVEKKRIWERDLTLEILKREEYIDSEAFANVEA